MKKLIRYEAARRALAEAKDIHEVKDVIHKGEAMMRYARLARDPDLMGCAVEMKFWAETSIGELIAELKAADKLAKPGGDHRGSKNPNANPTLDEQGIDKNLAKRARRRIAIPADQRVAVIDGIIAKQVALFEGDKELLAAIRAEKNAGKNEKRAAREKELATKITALPDKKFGVIYADPPWKFEFFSDAGANYAGPENHYPLSSTEDIMLLPVEGIAADDCALFLWATVPMLTQALEVMKAWGFTYKSNACWGKHKAGTGFWFRNQHELLLLGTRGKPPAPAPGNASKSLIMADARRHSQKPDIVYEMIESYFPTLPKIELNARGPAREGWEVWGNEADQD